MEVWGDSMKSSVILKKIRDEIVLMTHPEKIILYKHEVNMLNEFTGIKLCIIINTSDKKQLISKMYRELDCVIPFHLLIYTVSEWKSSIKTDFSLAQFIDSKGFVLYG